MLRTLWNAVLFILFSLLMPLSQAGDLKVGQVTLNTPIGLGSPAISKIVTFPIVFSVPPAVFVLPDDTNSDPMTLRVHSVTTTGFEIFVSESEGEDATTYPEQNFTYLAVEPGTYALASGDVLEVGVATGITNFQSGVAGGDSFFTQDFSPTATARYALTGAPTVITEIQSLNSDPGLLSGAGSVFIRATEPWLEAIHDDSTTANVDFTLTRAETSAGAISGSGEDIAWLAIDNGTDVTLTADSTALIEMKAITSPDSITENCTNVGFPSSFSTSTPIVFSSMHSIDGNNGGWVRECGIAAANVSVFIQEDQANDAEVGHTTENVTVLAFSESFAISTGTPMVVSSGTIPAAKGLALSFTPVSFGEPMNAPPIVFALATNEGSAPAMVRIKNASITGFEIAQVQPSSGTGGAPSMTVDYLAVVPGQHTLPDGTRLEAGQALVSQFQGSATGGVTSFNTTAINFSTPFTAMPAILLGIQTFNSDPTFNPSLPAVPFISTAARDKSFTGIDVALDFGKTSRGVPPAAELIGYLAAEPVASTIRVFDGSLIEYKILNSATTIQGVVEGCENVAFDHPFVSTTSPRVLATLNTYNGADGGWLRRCALSGSLVGLQVDEDETGGSSRSHGSSEMAGIFSFENSFHWELPRFEHAKTSEIESDPVNGVVNPKSLPGAQKIYSLTIGNPGRILADAGTVVINDEVPEKTTLFVGDLNGTGCPFEFIDGTDASGLALTCASGVELLSTAPPCVSPDNYCSISDFSFANDWDSSTITDFRIRMDNAFNSSDGSTSPEFTLRYRVRID